MKPNIVNNRLYLFVDVKLKKKPCAIFRDLSVVQPNEKELFHHVWYL